RLTAHLDTPCHFTLVVSLLQQLESLKTSPLQCAEVPFHATSIAHTGKTTRVPILLRYIMRNSVAQLSTKKALKHFGFSPIWKTRITRVLFETVKRRSLACVARKERFGRNTECRSAV